MELYMQKLLTILESASHNQAVPKMKIEEKELFDMQELLLDFNNLIGYQDNGVLKNSKVIRNAIDNSMFLDETFKEGTLQYESLLTQYRTLKELQDGESTAIINSELTKFCLNDVYMVFTKQGKTIRKHMQLKPFYNVQAQYAPKYNFDILKKSPNAEIDGDFIFAPNPNSYDKTTCFVQDDKMAFLGYDIRKNPFSKTHFRVFDENGEIKDKSKMDYTYLIRRIRDAEAHHQVYTYYSGRPYGGRVAPIGGGKCVLISNRWHEFLMRMSLIAEDKRLTEFKMFCVPHLQKPVKNDQECIDRIENIRKITVKTAMPINNVFAYDWLYKIIQNYEIVGTKNKTLEQYIQEQVTKKFGEAECTVEQLKNTLLLKGRLVGDTAFYNISNNDKENALEQARFIKHLLDNVYDSSFTTYECMTAGGKIKPIKINLQDLCLYLSAELPRLQNLAGVLKGSKWAKDTASHAGIEKQLALPILCAYKNLIRNRFIDDVAGYSNAPAGFALAGKQANDKRMISALDMDIFEIYKPNHKGDVITAKTFEQKAKVLRFLRNAIAHDGLSVQFSRNYDLSESKFVFDFGDYTKVRVNIAKFYEFINQPIFADYASMDKYTIQAADVKGLKEFIKGLCKNEKTHGSGYDIPEE